MYSIFEDNEWFLRKIRERRSTVKDGPISSIKITGLHRQRLALHPNLLENDVVVKAACERGPRV